MNRQPLDQEVSSNFYQTEEDAKEALVAVYDVLGYQSSPGVSWAPFVTVSDILSGDSYAGGADANDGFPDVDEPVTGTLTSQVEAVKPWGTVTIDSVAYDTVKVDEPTYAVITNLSSGT